MPKALSHASPSRTQLSPGIWGYVALAAFWAFAIIHPANLWSWEYYHDTPLLNYAGVLMHDFGKIPYRDIFETTMPGTFLFHYIIVMLGLETQTAFVTLGVLAIFALAGTGSLILWKIDRRAALVFAPFYLMIMLQLGPSALFQREILGLLAMSSALIIATRTGGLPYLWRQGLVGLLFGIACTIKPQFALGAPAAVLCLAALTWDEDSTRPILRSLMSGILASVAGFALPVLVTFWWLWSYGALDDFWSILTQYMPLYIEQTGSHEYVTPEMRRQYVLMFWVKFGGFSTLLPGALMLAFLTLRLRKQIKRAKQIRFYTFAALTGIYALVPILSGQFWTYHYFPFIFFAALSASALLSIVRAPFANQTTKLVCLALLAFTLASNVFAVQHLEWQQKNEKSRIALAKDMETSLRKWVPEGGRVQPVDWTEGALHAMMRARIPIATRFFYEFHFAHHVSRDINATLRTEFMDSLNANPPEVILVAHSRASVSGLDVSYDFPEFDAFRDGQYKRVEQDKRYAVYLRRDLAS